MRAWVAFVVILAVAVAALVLVWLKRRARASLVTGGGKFPAPIIAAARGGPVDYGLFDIVPESLYSSLMPTHIGRVNQVVSAFAPDAQRIVDATAHVGVDSANFMQLYPRAQVTSVELNPHTFVKLVNNLDAIAGTRSGTHRAVNANGVDYLLTDADRPDLIYLDPPWGGHSYKSGVCSPSLTDARGKKWDMSELSEKVLDRHPGARIVLKVPPNFPLRMLADRLGQRLSAVYPIAAGPLQTTRHSSPPRLAYWLAAIKNSHA
jgi:hypothetical protein